MADASAAKESKKDPLTIQAPDPGFTEEEDLISDVDINTYVSSGLKLYLRQQDYPIAAVDYTIAPFVDSGVSVAKMLLAAIEVEGPHIRWHELQQGQSLPDLISRCQNSEAEALVLINYEGTDVLNSEMISGVMKTTFPVLLLSQKDSCQLMQTLECYKDDALFAKVDVDNQVDVLTHRPLVESPGTTRHHQVETSNSEPTKGKGRRFLRKLLPDRRSPIDLMAEMNKLVSSSGGAVIFSEDRTKFCVAMSIFNNYEKHARPEPRDVNELLKSFQDLDVAVISRDFLFYILLAYRMHSEWKWGMYKCEELELFICWCIDTVERFTGKRVAEVFNAFIEKGDFPVLFEQRDTGTSIFYLLKIACIRMKRISEKRSTAPKPSSCHVLHSTMMWVSLALRLYSKCGNDMQSVENMWKTEMVATFQHTIILDKDTCVALREELEFGSMIHLEPSLTFGSSHLAELISSENHCRPFADIKRCIVTVKKFFLTGDQLYDLIVRLRCAYTNWLGKHHSDDLQAISLEGNLAGALEEGVNLLDELHTTWMGHIKTSPELIDDECAHWLKLLLQLIDITGSNPTSHLRRFITGEESIVCKKYRKRINKIVVTETESRFDRLTVQQFLPLLRAFNTIWSAPVVEEFLKTCKMPHTIHLNEPDWCLFINKLTERCNQSTILMFLKRIAEHYCKETRAHEFILDLISLKVPKLFSTEGKEKKEDTQPVAADFTKFLGEFIARKGLKSVVLEHLKHIMASISHDQSVFQQLVLLVIQREVIYIPEVAAGREIKSYANTSLYSALQIAIDHLSENISLQNPKQKFCWGLINSCCHKIPLAEKNFKWLYSYSRLLILLGNLFTTYCKAKKLETVLSEESVPVVLDDHKTFFEWVKHIQHILISWKERVAQRSINSDDIFLYESSSTSLCALGDAFSCSSLVIDEDELEQLKHNILKHFEQLNVLLLKYIPGQPDAKWCTLPSLLAEYGVSLPPNVSKLLSQHVQFPHEREKSFSDPLKKALEPAITRAFQPQLGICLNLNQTMCMTTLTGVVKDLLDFLQPVMEDLDMLVFFKLLRSFMFDRYLKLHIKKASAAVSLQGCDQTEGIPLHILVESLQHTRTLLLNILRGTAKYFDIRQYFVAEGELNLKTPKIEKELYILTDFMVHSKLSSVEYTGVSGVRCLLELFQYSAHISNIVQVCDQYELKGCLEDPQFQVLKELSNELQLEENRSALTPGDATEMLGRIKLLLCVERKSSECLDLFGAIRDSGDFYCFVNEMNFVKEEGQRRFYELHQLITLQLQHEEYNESVLNNLYVAFRYIGPFVNKEQNLNNLMRQVTDLNATNCMKQLETVNSNIALIQLWFSRAKGDTLENIGQDLSSIMRTGCYSFKLAHPEIILKFCPSVVGQDSQLPRQLGKVTEAADHGEIKWNSEQINDFTLKLGFLDSDKDEQGNEIKQFLHINEIASKLLKLYIDFRELGKPGYLMATFTEDLPCIIDQREAERKVKVTEQDLSTWKDKVASLHEEYGWLLFFSIPKRLTLYELLASKDVLQQLDRIVHEISFLCHNDSTPRDRFRSQVKSILPSFVKDISEQNAPMEVVGQFLGRVFENHTLLHRCGGQAQSRHAKMSRFSFNNATLQLHICDGYTQGQLMQVTVEVYNRVPEAFKVFRCQPTSTEEELKLFVNIINRHPSTFLVLEVNKLSYNLQELLMQMISRKLETETPFESSVVSHSELELSSCIHIIETAPSMLREFLQNEHKEPQLSFEETRKICRQKVSNPEDLFCVELVYGSAGDGKTYYIKQKLASSPASVTIAVNEAFTPLSAIKKLRSLPLMQKNCAIYFNFTMLPLGENDGSEDTVDDTYYDQYMELMEITGWFFFNLLILGYVEDRGTGLSFCIPGGLQWAIYIEVPSRDHDHCDKKSADEALRLFKKELPALALLCTDQYISPDTPYSVDEDVKLVCKYLRALKTGGTNGIDRLRTDQDGSIVKFSKDSITEEECHKLLVKYMPEHITKSKITQRLFIKYMQRRCGFLDNFKYFNLNEGIGEPIDKQGSVPIYTDTKTLGSTLMNTMLTEVSDFCHPVIRTNSAHQQLIYDFKDGEGSIGLVALYPENISKADKTKFKKIGVKIPAITDLNDRELLDRYLSRALNVELKDDRLSVIDESKYVLTIDYAVKMLSIHERRECGVPVIIEGETGVGKTALVEMLSKLWNHSQLLAWKKQKDSLMDLFQNCLGDVADISDNYQACVQTVQDMSSGKHVQEEDLVRLCQLMIDKYVEVYKDLKRCICQTKDDPVLALLSPHSKQDVSLKDFFAKAQCDTDCPKEIAHLLYAVLTAQVHSTFHKINVHAALTPSDIGAHFKPAFEQARHLKQAFDKQTKATPSRGSAIRTPFVTVFLDEVNTSSCLGLFKEIILDRSFDGKPIPENVFIVAACNPHRGNSTAVLAKKGDKEAWMRGTYYVRRLHPTLHFLMWDYGSLSTHQERDYISAKMNMLNKSIHKDEVPSLTELLVTCQNLMRGYAREHLKLCGVPARQAEISSHSCVSQRDIQRVFIIYEWLISTYTKFKPKFKRFSNSRRAVLVALGIVYYMRLNKQFRNKFASQLDEENKLPGHICFMEAFKQELDWYIKKVVLPAGIAHTQALKENIFATIVCCVNRIPLIIVGEPGSSKTLSFNQVISNLKGQESKVCLFRETDVFPSLDPHYYQCSRRTTSNEVKTVFSRAVNRQRNNSKLPINCVVFMDEAGLPEESHESLKVLHFYLDKQEVSFVAITNHVLDAAKTNRAISLYRPEAPDEDLETLAKGCFCSKSTLELKSDLKTIAKFCILYSRLRHKAENHEEFCRLFGLRDFIHFVSYLRRKRLSQGITPQTVMEALERNFNGSEQLFPNICNEFLEMMGSHPNKVNQRGILKLLEDSLRDRPQHISDQDLGDRTPEVRDQRSENEVRYKLIIDPSEDDSIIRFLFSFNILKRDNTRIFVCSDFPGDSHLQKINTIAAIRHSAVKGHTVVMSQTDDIHESFYDLFNQRFRMIHGLKEGTQHPTDLNGVSEDGTRLPSTPEENAEDVRYFTNISIGAHLKPSRVHPDFQCVVVLKKSEVEATPAPFLNRFEKYYISHCNLLSTVLGHMPYGMRAIVEFSKKKAVEFIDCISVDSLYGFKPETLDSLLLSILPFNHTYQQPLRERSVVDDGLSVQVYLMKEMLQALRHSTGFNIPADRTDELIQDAENVFALVLYEPVFEGLVSNLRHRKATLLVSEAMNTLDALRKPQDCEQHHLSSDVCMVIAVLQQWLVRYLCKKLMQLMTPEALILHRNKIPSSYLTHYLKHQSHFSLKQLISNQYNTLQKDCARCPTKLLCFTRYSALINRLPNMYRSTVLDTTQADHMETAEHTLQDLVFAEGDKLDVCKISRLSQSSIQKLLDDFARSDSTEVCLLVANMQEMSKQVVNHIRIMIEETEAVYPERKKLYVLLLHFPPAQLYEACYPSLFLRGWDHCYLDTIAHKAEEGVIDIQDWLWQCCFHKNVEDRMLESDSLMKTLKKILMPSIPFLTAHICFGSDEGRPFNCPMSNSERYKVLKELFIDKGVGTVLRGMFRSYWTPGNIEEALNQSAVMCCKNGEQTLSIADLIQMHFKELFYHFLAYMLSKINENYNLDLLFDADCKPVKELFIKILRVFPMPELSQVFVLSAHLSTQPSIKQLQPPRDQFPFFKLVYSAMESLVHQCHSETNVKVNLLNEEKSSGPVSQFECDQLVEIVTAKLKDIHKDKPNQSIPLAIDEMAKDNNLWKRYFTEFNYHKLHLENSSDFIAQQLLDGYFDTHEARTKVVGLHAHVCINHLEMASLATLLRAIAPIQNLHQIAAAGPSVLTSPPSESPQSLMSTFRLASHPLEVSEPNVLTSPPSESPQSLMSSLRQASHPQKISKPLGNFVIKTLFNTIIGSLFQDTASYMSKLKQWFKAYRDILSLPNMKHYIYSAVDCGGSRGSSVEARLNLMHVTYLFLQTDPVLHDNLLEQGSGLFQTLFNKYFYESQELKSKCPHLADIAPDAVNMVPGFGPHDSSSVRVIKEGLLAHFFCAERRSYHLDDVKWFLELTNEQVHMPHMHSSPSDSWTDGDFEMNVSEKAPKGALCAPQIHKFYLEQVLTKTKSTQDAFNPLPVYNHNVRLLVGNILCTTPGLGSPGPYIPNCYQDCLPVNEEETSKNLRMQQPLAHLYFLTVLEHLMSSQDKLANLVRTAKCIEGELESDHSDCDRVLMEIELQAYKQVVAQKFAKLVNPSKIREADVGNVNHLLSSETLSEEERQGHGMVVALHILTELKSTRRFSELMTEQCETVCDKIECLKYFPDHFKHLVATPKPHLLPFVADGAVGEFHSLYDQVRKIMLGIHNCSDAKLNKLIEIAKYCTTTTVKDQVQYLLSSFGVPEQLGSRTKSDKKLRFRMMVWLVAYFEFYDKKIMSQKLKDVIGEKEMLQFLLDECCVRLIQAFLCPSSFMINEPELPRPSKDEKHTDGIPAQPEGVVDPLFQLFVPEDSEQQDQSDIDLCHALANLVAVVLGSPPHSNHLWYHLFACNELKGTYMAGFMYDSKIGTEGLLFDCGVELTEDGLLGRQDYKQHANRGTYSLHSLYFLLWANFGSFCISLLTQPETEARLHGPIISNEVSVRHYCVSQLRSMWRHMRDSLGLSEEERSFFVMRLMWKFYESGGIERSKLNGLFNSQAELDSCETMWHNLYKHTVAEYRDNISAPANELLVTLKQLESRYPFSPQERDFTHSVVAHVEPPQQSSSGGELSLLFYFATEWPQLHAGGLLLPNLVKFYVWIHTKLAHLVTRERACTLTIGEVVGKASKRYKDDHLSLLYETVKVVYNDYVKSIGGHRLRTGNTTPLEIVITDDTPLMRFLTGLGLDEGCNDWLFIIVEDITSAQNTIIERFYAYLRAQQNHHLARLLSNEPAEIDLAEVNEHSCIMGKTNSRHDLVQLIRSRYQPPEITQQNQLLPSQHMRLQPMFQFAQLEEDVVVNFIAGKPLIRSGDTKGTGKSLHTPFKFHQPPQAQTSIVYNTIYADLFSIKKMLPDHFLVPLVITDQLRKQIEFVFHSADYNTMVAVLNGLKTVAKHLVKLLSRNTDHLEGQTVAEFIMKVYEQQASKLVLEEIGLSTLTVSQLECLTELPLPSLWSCLELFASWVDEGYYDYSSLPFALKSHMRAEDRQVMESLEKWVGSRQKLLNSLDLMRDLLKHSEKQMSATINEASQKSIMEYLEQEFSYVAEKGRLVMCIPNTILLQHYVYFRLALKRLILRLTRELGDANKLEDGSKQPPWSEVADGIWDKLIPQLRPQVDYPSSCKYGFQDISECCSEHSKLMDDLMNGSDRNEDHSDLKSPDEFVEEVTTDEDEQESVSFEDEAAKYTPELVAEFLRSIKMDEYVDNFLKKKEPVDGEFLLAADREDLSELGVSSAVACFKLQCLFKRVLRTGSTECSSAEVVQILEEHGLEKYENVFVQNKIDEDMIQEADNKLLSEVLKEIGVARATDRLKLQVIFKFSLKTGTGRKGFSVSKAVEVLMKNGLGKYKDAFVMHGISGDMVLEAENDLFKEVMEEIGVTRADGMRIERRFKRYSGN